MDVVLIYNGLGNQMSQYALYLRKKAENQEVRFICLNTAHNGIELGRVFGVDVSMSLLDKLLIVMYHVISTDKYPFVFKPLQSLLRVIGVSVLREGDNYAFKKEVLDQGSGLRFLSGGWHHSDYFNKIEDVIRKVYSFPLLTDETNLRVQKNATSDNVVAIHIRRGDFMDKDNYEKFGAVCTEDYYKKAIEAVRSIINHPHFYIFTNDTEWAHSFFKSGNYECVEWNTKNDSWKDLCLMSKFKHIIIANSTFSWWAAWLGYNNNKNGIVICPLKFISYELTPQESIYLDSWRKV